jgi:DNA-binding MarR family transcriptional regulator
MARPDLTGEVYRYLREVAVLLDDGDRGALAEVGLTPSHLTLLRLLGQASPDGLTVTRLAEATLSTRGNASRLVTRLAEAGLVATGPDPGDLRVVRVRLTATGRARLAQGSARHDALNRARLAALPAEDLTRLRDLLAAVSTGLRDHLAGPA